MNNAPTSPVEICKGKYRGYRGAYWVWPIDGTFDVHFVHEGEEGPEGIDVISEFYYTIEEALDYIDREVAQSRIDEMFNV